MDRLDRVSELVRAHVPRFKRVRKRDVWWMRLVGWVLRPILPEFGTDYALALGSTVYLPSRELDGDRLAATLLHELVHQLDQAEHGLVFYVTYALTPLPVWRTHRAHWERRAYAVDLMIAHHEGGDARLALVETRLRGIFGGPSYGWMWGGRVAAASYLKPVCDRIRRGELQREWPYDAILAAWKGPDRLPGPGARP